jgi:hypothetical protein
MNNNFEKQHEVLTFLFATHNWQEFVRYFLVPTREDILTKIKKTKNDKEATDRLLGQLEFIDKLIYHQELKDEVAHLLKVGAMSKK